MGRNAYISPYQLGALAYYTHSASERPEARPGEEIDRLFYATAFQAGLDKFVVEKFRSDYVHPYKFVRDRLKQSTGKHFQKTHSLIGDAFDALLPPAFRNREDEDSFRRFSYARRTEVFLCDLLVAMRNRSALLKVTPLPSIEDIHQLPLQLATPISTLVNSLECIKQDVPTPVHAIDRDVIKRFGELIQSDDYLRYSDAQSELDDSKNSTESAVSNIQKTGAKLLKHASRDLVSKSAIAQIITFVPKLVDLAFGKLPGQLADFAAKIATGVNEDRRRIVIYEYNPLIKQLVDSQTQRNHQSGR